VDGCVVEVDEGGRGRATHSDRKQSSRYINMISRNMKTFVYFIFSIKSIY
jgi:hypothetical protein